MCVSCCVCRLANRGPKEVHRPYSVIFCMCTWTMSPRTTVDIRANLCALQVTVQYCCLYRFTEWDYGAKNSSLSWQEINISGTFFKATFHWLNTLRPRQDGRRFADDTFKRIFLNENVRISIKISLKFVPKGPINNIPALVQIMAWRRSGDKPLSEPMMVTLPTHICVTRPQWVNVYEYV